MKRKLCLVMAMVLLSACFATMALGDEIVPFYAKMRSLMCSIGISGGTATCQGNLKISSGDSCKIVVTRQRKNGITWSNVPGASWSDSGTSSATKSGKKTVTKGYSYRVKASGYVYDANGKTLESGSTYSKTVDY